MVKRELWNTCETVATLESAGTQLLVSVKERLSLLMASNEFDTAELLQATEAQVVGVLMAANSDEEAKGIMTKVAAEAAKAKADAAQLAKLQAGGGQGGVGATGGSSTMRSMGGQYGRHSGGRTVRYLSPAEQARRSRGGQPGKMSQY